MPGHSDVSKEGDVNRRSGRVEAHGATILSLPEEKTDSTPEELRRPLAGQGLVSGNGAVRRFLKRHRITRIKTARASEQDRPDILTRRGRWFEDEPDLDRERLVFIDET